MFAQQLRAPGCGFGFVRLQDALDGWRSSYVYRAVMRVRRSQLCDCLERENATNVSFPPAGQSGFREHRLKSHLRKFITDNRDRTRADLAFHQGSDDRIKPA